MIINIFGSTGIIGSKSLKIISNFFPKIKINLLCANNNFSKLANQIEKYKPKYVYLNNEKKIKYLKSIINSKTKILNYDELNSYLKESYSDLSILSISGYKSLNYFDTILKNTKSLGLVSKEAVVSGGHLFKKYNKFNRSKIFPLDSEHFSIYNFLSSYKFNKSNINNLTLTASGGPFYGKKYTSLKNVTFKMASNHPKWNMGYKNSIDSATLSNKCLELIEAHYLFDISFNKLNIVIHPQSKIHSIFEFKNYLYNMIYFYNDMSIPIYHYLNQNLHYEFKKQKYLFNKNENLEFLDVKNDQFPIYNFFMKLDKDNPANLIKFNVANEFAVNLFKNNIIKYTDIYNIIIKISSLNLNYNLNTIKDIINYHELLEIKINEKINTII